MTNKKFPEEEIKTKDYLIRVQNIRPGDRIIVDISFTKYKDEKKVEDKSFTIKDIILNAPGSRYISEYIKMYGYDYSNFKVALEQLGIRYTPLFERVYQGGDCIKLKSEKIPGFKFTTKNYEVNVYDTYQLITSSEVLPVGMINVIPKEDKTTYKRDWKHGFKKEISDVVDKNDLVIESSCNLYLPKLIQRNTSGYIVPTGPNISNKERDAIVKKVSKNYKKYYHDLSKKKK